mmetsp:Transcript_2412/g.8104  ORF Transcript_2412/g.8104 Transcript_2412/m.8104 type:complete len:254 (+) Transcript_2412:723-1484(+)
MELGAKTLAIFLEPFVETLISLAASRMFRVPWTFTSWAAGEGDERKKYGRCRQHKLSHHLRRPHDRPTFDGELLSHRREHGRQMDDPGHLERLHRVPHGPLVAHIQFDCFQVVVGLDDLGGGGLGNIARDHVGLSEELPQDRHEVPSDLAISPRHQHDLLLMVLTQRFHIGLSEPLDPPVSSRAAHVLLRVCPPPKPTAVAGGSPAHTSPSLPPSKPSSLRQPDEPVSSQLSWFCRDWFCLSGLPPRRLVLHI